MILITLSFGNIVLIALGILLTLLSFRLMEMLGKLSEGVVVFLTRTGHQKAARIVLALLVGYDYHTYRKSRIILWNQVSIRFTLLWGCGLAIAVILILLRAGNKIESVGIAWLCCVAVYVGFRALIYWTAPARPISASASGVFVHDVKERTSSSSWPTHQIIRRWDYLDELFANPA